MQPTKKHSWQEDRPRPILNALAAAQSHIAAHRKPSEAKERPRPFADAVNHLADAATNVTQQIVEAKQKKQAEHDQLVADAARGKLLEQQRHTRDLQRVVDNIFE